MRHYAGSALMLLVTTAVIVGSYTVNLKVSAERAAVERLKTTLVADARRIRNLEAELRTRARPPQIQRWNDEVMMMGTPTAGQYLREATQLASFAVPAQPAQEMRNAVTIPAPAAPGVTAPIVRAAYRPGPGTGIGPGPAFASASASRQNAPVGVVAAAYRSARRPAPAPALVIVPDAAEPFAPLDLLPQGGQ